jgi:O-antigen ligase
MKWIPFLAFDTTLFFGMICIFTMIYRGVTKKVKMYPYYFFVLYVGSALFIWIALSCTHGLSKSYYLYKLMQTFLVFVSFFYPLFVFTSKRYLIAFMDSIIILGGIAVVLIFFLYTLARGDIQFYFHLSDTAVFGDKALPDYLGIGDLLVSAVLVNQRRNNSLFLSIKIGAFLCLVWLAGRGPFLGFLLMLAFDFILSFKLSLKRVSMYIAFIFFFIPIVGTQLYYWEGSEQLLFRLNAVAAGDDDSVGERSYMFSKAIEVIENNPFIGLGYGSYGMYILSEDLRLYPHNMFLEVFCETGFPGFLLLMILILGYLFFLFRKLYFNQNFQRSLFFGFSLASLSLFLQCLKASSIGDLRLMFGFIGLNIVCYYTNLYSKTSS